MVNQWLKQVRKSLREWGALTIQPLWWLMSAVLGGSLISVAVSLYVFISEAKGGKAIHVWPIGLFSGSMVLLLLLSFRAFHVVRKQRDQAREESEGYDTTEKEPWNVCFAKWVVVGQGIRNIERWPGTLTLDSRENRRSMRLWLKSQSQVRVKYIHLRIVDLPAKRQSQTWYLFYSFITFLWRLPYYTRGVNPYDWTERVRRAWRGGALFS
jgi:hypothetical protein